MPPAQVERLVLCLNEVLANVIAHGGEPANSQPIALRLAVSLNREDSQVNVTVSDACRAFETLCPFPRESDLHPSTNAR